MKKFFSAGAHVKDWHSFTASALLCYKLSCLEMEGVRVCVCVCFQIYMRESPLGVYCGNEIQSQIRDQRIRRKSPFVFPAAEIRKLKAILIDPWCTFCVFQPNPAHIIDWLYVSVLC